MRQAKALIRLRVCAGWSEALLVAHNTLLEIWCHGSIIIINMQHSIYVVWAAWLWCQSSKFIADVLACLSWHFTFQSTIFQSCQDIFVGRTSTLSVRIECFAQGYNIMLQWAQISSLSISIEALYHWATALVFVCILISPSTGRSNISLP